MKKQSFCTRVTFSDKVCEQFIPETNIVERRKEQGEKRVRWALASEFQKYKGPLTMNGRRGKESRTSWAREQERGGHL